MLISFCCFVTHTQYLSQEINIPANGHCIVLVTTKDSNQSWAHKPSPGFSLSKPFLFISSSVIIQSRCYSTRKSDRIYCEELFIVIIGWPLQSLLKSMTELPYDQDLTSSVLPNMQVNLLHFYKVWRDWSFNCLKLNSFCNRSNSWVLLPKLYFQSLGIYKLRLTEYGKIGHFTMT